MSETLKVKGAGPPVPAVQDPHASYGEDTRTLRSYALAEAAATSARLEAERLERERQNRRKRQGTLVRLLKNRLKWVVTPAELEALGDEATEITIEGLTFTTLGYAGRYDGPDLHLKQTCALCGEGGWRRIDDLYSLGLVLAEPPGGYRHEWDCLGAKREAEAEAEAARAPTPTPSPPPPPTVGEQFERLVEQVVLRMTGAV